MGVYIAIDLKSFYASVECVERGLDPLTTNLVVADAQRTEKTICLAVSPALKAYGIPGRARLFEVQQRVREINARRQWLAPGRRLEGKSCQAGELAGNPSLELDFWIAPPRMERYMRVSTQIYQIYLKYVAPEDIHVYSIDEVFLDAAPYLKAAGQSAREFAAGIMQDVLRTTGITATAGIGTNLYLSKVAMDIVAKHMEPEPGGGRIAELDEMSYRECLWDHRPLTDFWRLGPGYARKLEASGMFTMGDIALRSRVDEEWFYRSFGVNAGLLIDHAWGIEPCTIADIKAYRPESASVGSGQVLPRPYGAQEARLVVWEMAQLLALDLVRKGLTAGQVVLTLGYDRENLSGGGKMSYTGPVTTDRYGRRIPKNAHGSQNLERRTASARQITRAVLALFDRIAAPELTVRRIYLTATQVTQEQTGTPDWQAAQLNLFESPDRQAAQAEELARERRRQEAVLAIQERYGKNAILLGSNYLDGATTRERNGRIGGHKA